MRCCWQWGVHLWLCVQLVRRWRWKVQVQVMAAVMLLQQVQRCHSQQKPRVQPSPPQQLLGWVVA